MTHGIEFIASHFINLRLTQFVTGNIGQRKPDSEHLQLADSFNIKYSNRKATFHSVDRLLSDVSEALILSRIQGMPLMALLVVLNLRGGLRS